MSSPTLERSSGVTISDAGPKVFRHGSNVVFQSNSPLARYSALNTSNDFRLRQRLARWL